MNHDRYSRSFDVSEKIVTTDALLTQKAFCETLLRKKAHYVLPVKANHKQTLEDIKDLFKPQKPPNDRVNTEDYHARTFKTMHHEAGAHTDTCSYVEKAHGFITTRN